MVKEKMMKVSLYNLFTRLTWLGRYNLRTTSYATMHKFAYSQILFYLTMMHIEHIENQTTEISDHDLSEIMRIPFLIIMMKTHNTNYLIDKNI
jgi:hypothetical protein